MGALTTPRSQYRGRRPLAYLFPQLWYPVLPLLALGASLKPWHLSFLLTRVFCRPVGQAAALQPQGLVSARGLGVGEKQTFELLRQLAFPLDSFPGAETWGLGRHISPPTHPTPAPRVLETQMHWPGKKETVLTLCTTKVSARLRQETLMLLSQFLNWTTFLTFWPRCLSMKSFSPPVVHLQTVTPEQYDLTEEPGAVCS